MGMDTLSALKCFIRVAELGSFTAAARDLGVGQPAVSKMVAGLERSLGVRLVERTTTSVTLTEEGRRFHARSQAVVEDYAEAVAEVRGQTNRPVGKLVVAAPLGLGELRLNALFIEFLALYPRIELEMILGDRIIDLVEEGVDLAIRLGDALPPNVVARKLAASARILVAAPGYLKDRPPVRGPQDLRDHDYIRFAGIAALGRLEFSRGDERVVVEPGGRYSVNSSMALRECFLKGVGLGTAPAWLVQDLVDTGELVRLLPEWQMAPQPLHLVYPSRRYRPQRVRTLIQFLGARLPALPGLAPESR